MSDIFPAAALAALAATERPFQPGECAERARRAAVLISQAGLLPDEAGASYVLWQDEHSVAWLNVMRESRDTGYHDHDGSAAGVHVIAGSVTNEGLPVGGPRRVHRYGPGDAFWVPGSGVHRMDHDAGAVTVHVYSPPLRAIGSYEVADGLLQRVLGTARRGLAGEPAAAGRAEPARMTGRAGRQQRPDPAQPAGTPLPGCAVRPRAHPAGRFRRRRGRTCRPSGGRPAPVLVRPSHRRPPGPAWRPLP